MNELEAAIGNTTEPNSALNTNSMRARVRLFQIYNGYRTIISVLLIAIWLSPDTRNIVGSLDHERYLLGCGLLFISSALLYGRLGQLIRSNDTGLFGVMLADIVATTLIADASSGMLSGFYVLYMITVAAASLLLHKQILGTLIAAIAVLALLIDTLWLVSRDIADIGLMIPAGMLGSLLFAVSLLLQTLVRRLETAEAKIDEAEAQVALLQQLNQQIILHMETGIFLVAENRQITPINAAARRLLSIAGPETKRLVNISPELVVQFEAWRETKFHRPSPFQIKRDAPALIANFADLDENFESTVLMFIDDYTPVTQFAQSLKLNSLSQLTASIAHEIRNPLAAISHATQLLNENEMLNAGDQDLCRIVLHNSQRVNEIIESVTEVSRRQPPRFQSLDLPKWLKTFVITYYDQTTLDCEVNLSNAAASSVIVSVDPENLTRILTNLLDNALRHSQEETGAPLARIDIVPDTKGAQCHIDVVDFGHGVPEPNVPRLFEPFFTTSTTGSGLGLYLCKELCEINGAGLMYRPTTHDESCFRVSLKMETAKP